ncbi:UDP-glucose dehydrogenase family protein [Actinomyces capricornis]|uniref:UDP-glucose 6-dehydrogenase n=1 Tax=Actinomyces capricornis TaxID=2755559 RepID=A0ABN6K6D1_9ACTO|nr:UDP-glucose/GDP-mannose dehydrogenase family protein [Actinomyces capricornis]BDA65249.1 UDP-glucose 6-dehydrogenase [Actinomyces capricornis]
MRLTVIGCGYLGAVHAAAMAQLGHEVLGIDIDPIKAQKLAQGEAPFYEPELPELLVSGVERGNLRFTADPTEKGTAEWIAQADVHFIAVGTPQGTRAGEADLSQVWAAVDLLIPLLSGGRRPLVVGKSTVPVGTALQTARRLEGRARLVWNPEFLREGFAVKDTLHPDRIVYGLPQDPQEADSARAALDEVYAPMLEEGIARILTDYATAELVKTAANSFLATKISFINAMSTMCEATGADVTVLAQALGLDERIGRRFLHAGVGFGGGCLPKDIRALRASATTHGAQRLAGLLEQVDTINQDQRDHVVDLALERLGRGADRAAVTILGAAFKPNSDDLRDSPALDVAERLADHGARVTIHDPHAMDRVRQDHPRLLPAASPEQALEGAELVILATEWAEFTGMDPHRAAQLVAQPVIIDARNALDPAAWREAGWDYRGIGR